ncbi:MAG: single-stranded DNA-binding protein [Patescibacteria group bacterium]|nr:single-stranded DNA-binding protein [Patescibacteria group bacterium]
MRGFNKAIIAGNATRDPELRSIPSGQSVTSFSVATNRRFKDSSGENQDSVEFHNVVAWGKLAEICGQYVKKGTPILIEGRLQTRSWEGQDGAKRQTTEIVAENMVLLGQKGMVNEVNNGETEATDSVPTSKKTGANKSAKDKKDNDEIIDIDDIDF